MLPLSTYKLETFFHLKNYELKQILIFHICNLFLEGNKQVGPPLDAPALSHVMFLNILMDSLQIWITNFDSTVSIVNE